MSRAPDAAQRSLAVRCRAGAHATADSVAFWVRLCVAPLRASPCPGHETHPRVSAPRTTAVHTLTHLSGRAPGAGHLSGRVLFSGHLLCFEHFLCSPCWLALGGR